MINRMQAADPVSPILRPSSKALCEGIQRYATRKVEDQVDASRLRKGRELPTPTPLQQSQQLLQQQDYINYQIQPNLVRRNSKEWVPEYKKERIDKINYNNVFGGMNDKTNNEIPTLSPPPPHPREGLHAASVSRGRSESLSSEASSSKFSSLLQPDSPVSSSTATTVESVSSSSQPPPILSAAARTDKPSPNDVICGRGGKANTHPGNIAFRTEAKKLRSWYESSSKSEKFTISSVLVDIVRERGGRFLKRNDDGEGWTEADGNDVRKKASQALREGRKEDRR